MQPVSHFILYIQFTPRDEVGPCACAWASHSGHGGRSRHCAGSGTRWGHDPGNGSHGVDRGGHDAGHGGPSAVTEPITADMATDRRLRRGRRGDAWVGPAAGTAATKQCGRSGHGQAWRVAGSAGRGRLQQWRQPPEMLLSQGLGRRDKTNKASTSGICILLLFFLLERWGFYTAKLLHPLLNLVKAY